MPTAKFLAIALLGLLLFVPAGCGPNINRSPAGVPIVRVRLLSNQPQVSLACRSAALFLSSGETTPRRLEFPSSGSVALTYSPAGWRVGNVAFKPGELTIKPDALGALTVNTLAYRGDYRCVPTGPDRFDLINEVDVDSYLMSVVSSEMLRDWLPEAYKAQAIAARTYVLYEARTSGVGRPFDVEDDTRSQVYGGLANESDKSRQAVLDTAGIVVAYGPPGQEKIFKAYFSACCGGVGQSAYDAFGDADIPPLRDKNVGAMCSASPRFNWKPLVLSKDELTRRVRVWGTRKNRPEKDMSRIDHVDIAAVNRYNRPIRFVITDARGTQYSLGSEEFRNACNADPNGGPTLLSSFMRPIADAETIQFVEGHGFGHGVGLCQWCAQCRAVMGQRHEDIVRLAYPGAVLVRAY